MARLIISSPDGKNGILELNKPVITVGRGNANDLVLNDASVSRFHAVIKLRDNSIFVADRGSTNGIVLNDVKISKETGCGWKMWTTKDFRSDGANGLPR
jgi:pSer/pThr/pTyr-binding forkhead associated (FHA) protein